MEKHEVPFDLNRFLDAQEGVIEYALLELKRGRKESHWMWFVFPQLEGLGKSPMAQNYAIQNRQEARAYLDHPVLGNRLRECCLALLRHPNQSISHILESPDDTKLRSCMTLFAEVAEDPSIFLNVLDTFFAGHPDPLTVELLSRDPENNLTPQ